MFVTYPIVTFRASYNTLLLVNDQWYLLTDMEIKMDTLLSVDDAARRLGGISKWNVYAWLSQGLMLRTKVAGRTMSRESELEKVDEDGGKSPTACRKR